MFDRLVVALLLQVELSEVDLRTDVVRVHLQDALERPASLIFASSARARAEAEDVQRVRVLRQEARGFGRFALGAVEIERIKERNRKIHARDRE